MFRVKFKSLFGYNPIVLCLIFWSELKTVHASLPTYRSIKKPTYLSRCFSRKLFGSLKVAFNILSNNWIIIVLKASYVTLDPYVMLIHRLTPYFRCCPYLTSYSRGMRTIHKVVRMIDRNRHPTHSEPIRFITNLSIAVRS